MVVSEFTITLIQEFEEVMSLSSFLLQFIKISVRILTEFDRSREPDVSCLRRDRTARGGERLFDDFRKTSCVETPVFFMNLSNIVLLLISNLVMTSKNCYNCNKPGHFARDCSSPKKAAGGGGASFGGGYVDNYGFSRQIITIVVDTLY